jgi:signal transduction histidine kinase
VISVITVSLSSINLLVFFLFGRYFGHGIGDRMILRMQGAEDGHNYLEELDLESRPAFDPSFQDKFLHRPPDNFIERTQDDVIGSLVGLFILCTLIIVISSGIVIYFATKKMLKKMQDEHDRMVKLVSDASHDLRTPLTVIQGYAGLYMVKNGASVEIDKIFQNAKRMNELLEDMLVLAKVDNEKSALLFQDVNLSELLNDLITSLEDTNTDRKFVLKLPESAILLKSDPRKLRRVLDNLLSNALKYTPTDTPITITLEYTQYEVKIQVIDEGPGVHKEKLNKIFDRFTTVDENRTTKGNGLGLAICRDFVHLLGGRIKAVQTHPDLGTGLTVQIWLPTQSTSK